MYSTPSGYADAVTSEDRTVDILLSIGTGIDNTAADDLSTISGSFLPMTNTSQATDAIYYMTDELATFEGYGIKTAASAGIIAPPLEAVHYPPETSIWSDCISDAEGNIAFTFSLNLSAEHQSALRIYTTGPSVIEASAVYTDADGTATTKAFTCYEGYIEVRDVMAYSTIAVTISKIDGAYRHVRIVEVEFGASISISKSEVGGEVTVIRELDPTEKSAPMGELDVTILNVTGTFDPDNPSTRLGEIQVGYPLYLSFVVKADGKQYTIPSGRYVIGERDSSDTRLKLAAFDARFSLSELYTTWTMPADQSLGQTLDDLLTDYSIPHIVDDALYEVMPDGEFTFDDESTLFEDLLTIQQAYAIFFIPDHRGSIELTGTWPSDAYGSIPTATIFSWPSPKQTKRYNYVQVGYKVEEGSATKTYYVETDLRTDPTEGKVVLQITDNKLITTSGRATSLMNRLITRLYDEEVETDIRGDPAMDLGDVVEIPGKWTQDAPRSYKVTYIEETYDGTYRATVRGTR